MSGSGLDARKKVGCACVGTIQGVLRLPEPSVDTSGDLVPQEVICSQML